MRRLRKLGKRLVIRIYVMSRGVIPRPLNASEKSFIKENSAFWSQYITGASTLKDKLRRIQNMFWFNKVVALCFYVMLPWLTLSVSPGM